MPSVRSRSRGSQWGVFSRERAIRDDERRSIRRAIFGRRPKLGRRRSRRLWARRTISPSRAQVSRATRRCRCRDDQRPHRAMAHISLKHVQPGMVLAADAVATGNRLLLRAGDEITETHLQTLRMWDIAGVLNAELRQLVAAGCKVVQIEEPAIHSSAAWGADEATLDFLVDLFNYTVEGLDEAEIWVHTCWGNPGAQHCFDPAISYEPSFEIRLSVSKSPPSSESRSILPAKVCAIGCATPCNAQVTAARPKRAGRIAYRMAALRHIAFEL